MHGIVRHTMVDKLLGYSPMTSNNQITLKEPVRDRLKLKPGDHVGFFEKNGEVIVKKVRIIVE